MKKVWFIASLFLTVSTYAQVNIIPQPAELKMPETAGQFVITAKTPIILEGSGLENSARFLNDYLKQLYGFTLPVTKKPALLLVSG